MLLFLNPRTVIFSILLSWNKWMTKWGSLSTTTFSISQWNNWVLLESWQDLLLWRTNTIFLQTILGFTFIWTFRSPLRSFCSYWSIIPMFTLILKLFNKFLFFPSFMHSSNSSLSRSNISNAFAWLERILLCLQ